MVYISTTIKDIAKMCGVSEGTVDRAINNRGGIKKETKEKILEMVKKLDYKPNHIASCLAKGNTKTIGVVCAELMNPFFSSLVQAIERAARDNGYFITLILTHNSVNRELEGIGYLAERQVDGLIIFPVGKGKEYEEKLLMYNLPIVTVYNRISDKFVHVDVDCRQIMREAVLRVADKGYKKIAYIDPGYDNPEVQKKNRFSLNERRLGFIQGIEDIKLGKPDIFTEIKWESIEGYLKENDEKTAIMCPFDRVALKLLDILKMKGIKVPEQVGIMGFDNIPMLDLITPRLYSVDCDTNNLGRKAVSMLLNIINKEEYAGNFYVNYAFTDGQSL